MTKLQFPIWESCVLAWLGNLQRKQGSSTTAEAEWLWVAFLCWVRSVPGLPPAFSNTMDFLTRCKNPGPEVLEAALQFPHFPWDLGKFSLKKITSLPCNCWKNLGIFTVISFTFPPVWLIKQHSIIYIILKTKEREELMYPCFKSRILSYVQDFSMIPWLYPERNNRFSLKVYMPLLPPNLPLSPSKMPSRSYQPGHPLSTQSEELSTWLVNLKNIDTGKYKSKLFFSLTKT